MGKPITAEMIKELRERTGVAVGKCKEALEKSGGDIQSAIDHLRRSGIASAVKKEGRETREGEIKVGEDEKSFVLVEVNTETDFVAKNEKFQNFASNLLEEIKRLTPTTLAEFLSAKYSKDPSLTIDEYRANLVQLLGENIQIRRCELFIKKKGCSVAIYSHMGGKLVTLVELSASGEEELAKDIAMHIAAESPEYLSSDEVPGRIVEHEKEIARAQIKGKPEAIIEKIIEGKLKAYFAQVCLLYQPYVKEPSLTVADLVMRRAKESKKELKINQFLRWKVGE